MVGISFLHLRLSRNCDCCCCCWDFCHFEVIETSVLSFKDFQVQQASSMSIWMHKMDTKTFFLFLLFDDLSIILLSFLPLICLPQAMQQHLKRDLSSWDREYSWQHHCLLLMAQLSVVFSLARRLSFCKHGWPSDMKTMSGSSCSK